MTNLKSRHPQKMVMGIFLVAAWSLWKERNNNYFRKVTPSISSWKARFVADFSNIVHRLPEHKKHLIADFIATVD